MNYIKWLIKMALVCCLWTMSVQAQMGMGTRPPSLRGVFHPVAGAGAKYSIEGPGDNKSSLEISILGKEAVNGKDGYWMEMGLEAPNMGGTFYMKTLVWLDGDKMVTERRIMQMPGQPPMEMPSQMANRGGRPPQTADVRKDADLIGTETIATPAGTFACEHWRQKDGSGDVWINDKVAPWGLVKMVGKDTTLTLQQLITDAKTHITGTPQTFDPSQMMQQHQQQQ